MDGSTSTFLRDNPLFDDGDMAAVGLTDVGGILYVEDFDALPEQEVAPAATPEPVYNAHDLAAAHEAGRQEGLQSALDDAVLLQAQLRVATEQALVDALMAARLSLERIAAQRAEDVGATILAILQAVVPAISARHAASELRGVLDVLLPGLRCEPELRVRTHPDLADHIRETLIALLPDDSVTLSVAADAAFTEGDLHIAWEDGHARRDCAAVWDGIRNALHELDLPPIKEICHGERL